MQTLTLIWMTLSSKLDSYSRTVIWNSSKCSVVVASTKWHKKFVKYIRIWKIQTRWLKPLSQAKHDQTQNSLSLNHIMMWTSLVTLVNSLDVGHMAMWPVSVNHMTMWTRLLTLVQVGDCWKYALEAIINWLLLYFLVHDNRLLSMLELYW